MKSKKTVGWWTRDSENWLLNESSRLGKCREIVLQQSLISNKQLGSKIKLMHSKIDRKVKEGIEGIELDLSSMVKKLLLTSSL